MTPEQKKRWLKELESFRRDKDRFMLSHPSSPILPEHRRKLKGLPYFPPNEKFYFELALHEYDRKEVVEIQDTGGRLRRFLRWGAFRFQVDGHECVLQAYKGSPSDDSLFVPFRDATNGKETYGAGRYLDLYEERDRTNWGWVLDFNLAYNPYCAYSPHYVCPFVPPENWLEVEIRAGEKAFPFPVEGT